MNIDLSPDTMLKDFLILPSQFLGYILEDEDAWSTVSPCCGRFCTEINYWHLLATMVIGLLISLWCEQIHNCAHEDHIPGRHIPRLILKVWYTPKFCFSDGLLHIRILSIECWITEASIWANRNKSRLFAIMCFLGIYVDHGINRR